MHYAESMMRACDSIDAATIRFPVDFRCSGHWYRRLAWWMLDVAMHNSYVILNFHYGRDGIGAHRYPTNCDGPIFEKCYCEEDSIVRNSKSKKTGKHCCYVDRDGMSAHRKYYRDVSRRLIERCDREIASDIEKNGDGLSMRPGVKGRTNGGKRKNDDTPGTPSTVPATPQSATPGCSAKSTPASRQKRVREFQHLHSDESHQGHHKFEKLGGRAKCSVCKLLKDKGKATKPIAYIETGCAKCGKASNSAGLRMCKEHWNTELGAAVHRAGGDITEIKDRLAEFHEVVDGVERLKPLAEPSTKKARSKKSESEAEKIEYIMSLIANLDNDGKSQIIAKTTNLMESE